jgi:uncharacterized membrane protein
MQGFPAATLSAAPAKNQIAEYGRSFAFRASGSIRFMLLKTAHAKASVCNLTNDCRFKTK